MTREDIVCCVECRQAVPKQQATEERSGYFTCSLECHQTHNLRHQRYTEGMIDTEDRK